MNRIFRVTTLLLGVWLCCAVGVAWLSRRHPVDDYLLIVSSNMRDNDQALYLMTPNGSLLKKLTSIPGSETLLDHSPDGKWLVIQSDVNKNYYSVNITTSTVRQIMDSWGRYIKMSPDSQSVYVTQAIENSEYAILRISPHDAASDEIFRYRIYLESIKVSPDGALLYVQSDSLIRIQLPSDTVEPFGYEPSRIIGCSADGEWIYVEAFESGSPTMYRIGADSNDPQLVLTTIGRIHAAYPSPDGQWLLLQTGDITNSDYIRLSLNDDDPPFLLATGDFKGWSDDGKTFLLWLYPDTDRPSSLCRMDILTGECFNIIENISTLVAQSPTTDQILYTHRNQNSQQEHFLINADGTDQRPIVYGNSALFRDWSPDGEWLYFDDRDHSHPSLFRVHAATGRREIVHQPFSDNNSHAIFQSFIPLYPIDSSLITSLLLSTALTCIGLVLTIRHHRRISQ